MNFPALNDPVNDPGSGFLSLRNSATTAIADGTWVRLTVIPTNLQARAREALPATADPINRGHFVMGVANNNPRKRIAVGEFGLVQTWGYVKSCAADANGWAGTGVIIELNTSGVASDTSSVLNTVTTGHTRGIRLGTPGAPSSGTTGAVFVMKGM